MSSTIQQVYDFGEATLTIAWEADRPATADELALIARVAGIIEGRAAKAARREG